MPYESNLLWLQLFFMTCGIVSLAFPEGQHHTEAASCPLFGFPLMGATPWHPVHDSKQAKNMKAMVPSNSTLHVQVLTEGILPSDLNKLG